MMGRRDYLYGCDGGMDVASKDVGKVRCPIWQCSGNLYLKFRNVKIDNDSAWQLPDIVCDDCKTVFSNTMRVKMVIEEKERKKTPAMIYTPFSEADFKLGLNKPKSKSNPNGLVKK